MTSRNKILLAILALLLPSATYGAAEFTPLVELPGLSADIVNGSGLSEYINYLLRLSIIAGALIAVVKLILAGVQYVGNDLITDKSDAKKDIQSALLGLGIIILAITILTTINPNITKVTILPSAPPVADIYSTPTEADRTLDETVDELDCEDGFIPGIIRGAARCIRERERSDNVLLSLDNTDFSATTIDETTLTDAREREPRLRDIPVGDIVGYLELDIRTEEGQAILERYDYDQDLMERELLRGKCGSTNRLVTVNRFAFTTGYYCIKRR